eukprot:PhF_6_TR13022/c1_g1_i1/m.20652
MSLFEVIPVDEQYVRDVVVREFNLKIVAALKASQNHTFSACAADSTDNTVTHFIRVSPDPHGTKLPTIELEMKFLQYLKAHGIAVCGGKSDGKSPLFVGEGNVVICAFEKAQGSPIDIFSWKWINETEAAALGRWIGQFHKVSKQFVKEHGGLVNIPNARNWDTLHDGVLKGVEIAPEDIASISDPDVFGIIHGDVNISNFHYSAELDQVYMFDWDQMQKGWFLYDLSSPIWTVVTFQRGGNPIDRTPVPEANVEAYTNWLLQGYEKEMGVAVDRAALARMIGLRRQLYVRFCSRAMTELPPDHGMYGFCAFMNTWLSKEE